MTDSFVAPAWIASIDVGVLSGSRDAMNFATQLSCLLEAVTIDMANGSAGKKVAEHINSRELGLKKNSHTSDALTDDVRYLNMLWLAFTATRTDMYDARYATVDARRPVSGMLLPLMLDRVERTITAWNDYADRNGSMGEAARDAFLCGIAPLLNELNDYKHPINNDYGDAVPFHTASICAMAPRKRAADIIRFPDGITSASPR